MHRVTERSYLVCSTKRVPSTGYLHLSTGPNLTLSQLPGGEADEQQGNDAANSRSIGGRDNSAGQPSWVTSHRHSSTARTTPQACPVSDGEGPRHIESAVANVSPVRVLGLRKQPVDPHSGGTIDHAMHLSPARMANPDDAGNLVIAQQRACATFVNATLLVCL